MEKKTLTLIEGNEHLRDAAKRENAIVNFIYGANKLEGLKVSKKTTREHYREIAKKPFRKSRSRLLRDL